MPRNGSPIFTSTGTYYGDTVTLASSAARTSSGSGSSVSTADFHTLRLTLAVAAASGTTPSLSVTVETSGDGSTWYSVGAFAAKTAAATERKSFSGLDRYVRASWAVSGTTPSFTFSVTGEGV